MADQVKYRLDPANGYLIGPDGCHYENEHQVHHYAELHLCGCGLPEEAYNFCRDMLAVFDRRDKSKGLVDAEKGLETLICARPDLAAHAFAHMLSHLKLLEHGGSVGGSWLTDLGAAIVDLRPAVEADFDDN